MAIHFQTYGWVHARTHTHTCTLIMHASTRTRRVDSTNLRFIAINLSGKLEITIQMRLLSPKCMPCYARNRTCSVANCWRPPILRITCEIGKRVNEYTMWVFFMQIHSTYEQIRQHKSQARRIMKSSSS